jgi:hypothetical protein
MKWSEMHAIDVAPGLDARDASPRLFQGPTPEPLLVKWSW